MDKLARGGSSRPKIDVYLQREIKEEYGDIEKYCINIWQNEYTASATGQIYREIEPVVGTQVKFTSTNRQKENTLTRLRLGKCKLNKYLFDIKRHPDSNCGNCGVPETIEHILLNCKYNCYPEKLKENAEKSTLNQR